MSESSEPEGVKHSEHHITHHIEEHEPHREKQSVKKNFKDFLKIFKKNKKIMGVAFVLVLLLIPIYYSLSLRLMPVYLPKADEWAQQSVERFYRSNIENDINNKYAYLPTAKRTELIEREFQRILVEEKDNVEAQREGVAADIRSGFQDKNGDTYLIAIDPYMHYQYAKNYIENGHSGNILVDGKPYNTLRYGQIPKIEVPRFHPWLLAKLYNIMKVFKPDISIMRSVFFFPAILCTLAVLPAFFIGRRLGGNLGGLITSVIVAVHQSILSRTVAGFSDTDAYNVFFPLIILWIFIEMMVSKDKKTTIALGVVNGFFVGAYSIAWTGWWYTFDFIMAYVVIASLFYLIKHIVEHKGKIKHIFQKDVKRTINWGGSFFVSSLVFVAILKTTFGKLPFGQAVGFFFRRVLLEPFSFLKFKEVAVTSIWPNVFTTVAELNLVGLNKVINSISLGSIIMFAFALIGIVVLMVKKGKKLSKIDYWFLIISVVWYLIIAKWQQQLAGDPIVFAILIGLPLAGAVVLAIFFDSKLQVEFPILLTIFFTATLFSSTRGVRLLLIQIVLFILIVLLIFPTQLSVAKQQALNELPSMTDAWYNTLIKIKDSSDKSVTTSWWDFGHWFVAISERSVTFDGGSQGKRIHWVGKTLLTDDEDEAINILRMLNCGQELPVEILENYTGDDYNTVKILYRIIGEEIDEAKQTLLEQGLTDEQADKLLNYTHCEPIDQYYIASGDMVSKAGVWSHFGGWDFTRGVMFNRVKKKNQQEGVKILMEQFNLTQAEADKTYFDIKSKGGDEFVTGWPSYAGNTKSQCAMQNQTIVCQNGLVYNHATGEATIQTREGLQTPVSISFTIEGEFRTLEFDNSTIGLSAIIYPERDSLFSIIMDPVHVNSMFTRLFFFNGVGLEHFELISYERDIIGQEIYLYKVNWNPGNSTNETSE